jgi:DNA-binding IclR family transcriptional regulator
MNMDDTDAGRRRGIQSVEIGAKILQALTSLGCASTLSTIAGASEMAAPQVHRYLQSLIISGMAVQDAGTGLYDLGPAAVRIGLAALGRTDAFRLVDSLVSKYSEDTGQTVQIAALGPQGPTIVRWYSGVPAISTSLSVGSVLSLLYSATGRVFLTYVPRAETDTIVARELKRSKMTKGEVDSICQKVREQGAARVNGTVIPGLNGTAFPIFDLQGRAILTATALWSEAMSLEEDDQTVVQLGNLCREISLQLGWPGH